MLIDQNLGLLATMMQDLGMCIPSRTATSYITWRFGRWYFWAFWGHPFLQNSHKRVEEGLADGSSQEVCSSRVSFENQLQACCGDPFHGLVFGSYYLAALHCHGVPCWCYNHKYTIYVQLQLAIKGYTSHIDPGTTSSEWSQRKGPGALN